MPRSSIGGNDAMDMLINAANVLYVLAYFTKDMIRLRCLTLIAAGCLIAYFASRPEPLWTVVAWNTFFLCLNLFQLGRLLLANRDGQPAGDGAGAGA
jgi:predicted signal transduction protein with EAL and GGDEF domain